jgi:hypothetical protein
MEGYQLLQTRDNFSYWIKTAETPDEPLLLTETEILNNFYILA